MFGSDSNVRPGAQPDGERLRALETRVEELVREVAELRAELDATRRVAAHQMEVAELRSQVQALRGTARQPEPVALRQERETVPGPRPSAAEPERRPGATPGEPRGAGTVTPGADRTPSVKGSPARATVELKRRRPRLPSDPRTLPAETLFERGVDQHRRGNVAQSMATFALLVRQHPTHRLAAPAQLKVADTYAERGEFRQAVPEYRRAFALAPAGETAPGALHRMGVAYQGMKRSDLAREAWQRLVHDFPDSAEAAEVRARLAPRAGVPPTTRVARHS